MNVEAFDQSFSVSPYACFDMDEESSAMGVNYRAHTRKELTRVAAHGGTECVSKILIERT